MKKHNGKFTPLNEWKQRLLFTVSGLLLFETLTGLSIYFMPFTVSNQVMVLLHSGMGLVFILPFAWYQVRHWFIYHKRKFNHFMLTGYISMIITLISAVSGIILTYQSVFLTRISQSWDLIHVVTTFALIIFLTPHVVIILIRDRTASGNNPVWQAQKIYLLKTMLICFMAFVLVGLWQITYSPVPLQNTFPTDYSYLYGDDHPFSPSLATTSSGGAFDARSLAGSKSCGTTGCHEEIYKEWQVSAHRYSAMDVGFQTVQGVMASQNGPESTRYCGGCHDPISLFSGSKNLYSKKDDLTNAHGYQEGISCIACHAIKETDIKGNANYVMTQPKRYMYELDSGRAAKYISDFLIRSYPTYHKKSLQHKMFKSPKFCAACHKQFIDEQVNNVGWVQLQNQYDNWRKSKWNHPGDPTKTIECRECHMPLIASQDPGNGDDLDYNRNPDDHKHRSHRFLAANQFMPKVLNLPGADEQIALTQKWLKGQIRIPEIANKWKTGPAVPIKLIVPDTVKQGQEINIQAMITNNKVGHEFPTGPLDIIQAWVEITAKDQSGNVVFTSGHMNKEHFVEPGSFMFKAEPVDQYGNLIDKHNLWEMVGVRYKRAMFPGFSDKATFSFPCPASVKTFDTDSLTRQTFKFTAPDRITQLTITARLKYRKFDQYLLNFLFGKDAGITATASILSEDEKVVNINSGP